MSALAVIPPEGLAKLAKLKAVMSRAWTEPAVMGALVKTLVELGYLDAAAIAKMVAGDTTEGERYSALALEKEVRTLIASVLVAPGSKVELLPASNAFVVWGAKEELTGGTSAFRRLFSSASVTRNVPVAGVWRQPPTLAPSVLAAVAQSALLEAASARETSTSVVGTLEDICAPFALAPADPPNDRTMIATRRRVDRDRGAKKKRHKGRAKKRTKAARSK